MIETKVFFDKNATSTIAYGINQAANAVKVTLGAAGRVVYYNNAKHTAQGIQFYRPKATKDGVTVLKNFELTDQIENFGVELIKEVSAKTADEVGDATTTTAILLQEIMNGGLELVADGLNPMEIKKGMEYATDLVVSKLKDAAINIDTDIDAIRQIATVSANNDAVIGGLISDAYNKIGKNGIIKIERSETSKTEIKITQGFELRQGYIHPYFITNLAKGECELNNPYILFYEKEIVRMEEILPLLEKVLAERRQLLIFCEDLDGAALSTMAAAVKNRDIVACAVKSPFFGERKVEAMNDMAILTGGRFINMAEGIKLETVDLSMLGSAAKVTISRNKTLIIGSNGDTIQIANHIKDLSEKAIDISDADEKAYMQNRVAKLSGGIAMMYVGATTEAECDEKIDRCEDAVLATRAAIEEGYLVGGGCSFLKLMDLPIKKGSNSYEAGQFLILKSITSPFRQILANAGIDGDNMIAEIAKSNSNVGYNVLSEKICDMVKDGIIDPVKALRCSLQNAASVAATILITGCVFARKVKD